MFIRSCVSVAILAGKSSYSSRTRIIERTKDGAEIVFERTMYLGVCPWRTTP